MKEKCEALTSEEIFLEHSNSSVVNLRKEKESFWNRGDLSNSILLEKDAVKYVRPEFWMHRVISDLVGGEASSKIIKPRDYLFFRLPCRATVCDPRFHVLRMEKNDKFSWALPEEQFSRAIVSFEFELID